MSGPSAAEPFDPDCRRCPRLASYLAAVRSEFPSYHGRPVPSFGADRPRLLVVGLAPGLHGANATGRPFTGDHAGILLYRTLHELGFSSEPVSTAPHDGLRLRDCRITNAVRCVPPANRPTGQEVSSCNVFLRDELGRVPAGGVILALGGVAHKATAAALGRRQRDLPFAHGAEHALPGDRYLVDSYHCSRYNTQTGRLTAGMFRTALARARSLIYASP